MAGFGYKKKEREKERKIKQKCKQKGISASKILDIIEFYRFYVRLFLQDIRFVL